MSGFYHQLTLDHLIPGKERKRLKIEEAKKVIKEFRESCPDARQALTEHGNPNNVTVWHDWLTDTIKFSRNYPEILFDLFLKGPGEGVYVVNGKYQNYNLVPERFIYSKLKELGE